MKAFTQVKSFARMESALVFHSRETLYQSECFHAILIIYKYAFSVISNLFI